MPPEDTRPVTQPTFPLIPAQRSPLQDDAERAGTAINKVIESRNPESALDAAKDLLALFARGKANGLTWQAWAGIAAVILTTVGSAWTGISSVSHEASKTREAVKAVKDDLPVVPPTPTPADETVKLLAAWISESRESSKLLAKQLASIDAKLAPAIDPLNPDAEPIKPRPKPAQKLSVPKQVTLIAGSANAVKIKATGATDIQWTWEPSQGLEVDKHGATAYVSVEKDGLYWVFAYTMKNGVIDQIAACMVVAGEAPRPPPGPNPKPDPPVPPIDVFQVRMQAAYEADGKLAAWAVMLANIYRESDVIVNDPACKKASSVILAMHKKIEAKMPHMLLKVRAVIADALDISLGEVDFSLTPESRKKISAQFSRILKALEELK